MLHPLVRVWAALAAVLLVCPVATGRPQGTQPGPPLTIDGEPVPWSTFGAWLVQLRGEAAVEGFVQRELVERLARKEGVTVANELVDATIEGEIALRIERAFGGDAAKWLEEVERLGSSPEGLRLKRRTELRPTLLANAVLVARRVVTEDELRALFEKRYGQDGRRLWLRVLRLKLAVETPASGESLQARQARNRAAQDALIARLNELRARVQGGESFAALAREFSQDPQTAEAGGEMPATFEAPDWPGPVTAAVYALEGAGDVCEPVYGRGHFNLFQLVREERTELAGVRDGLAQELKVRDASANEMTAFRRSIREAADVRVLPALYSGDEDMTAVVLTIDGVETTRATFASWLAAMQGESFARTFVEAYLTERAATAAGISVLPEEVRARVDFEIQTMVERFFEGDIAKWHADLARKSKNEPQVRRERAQRSRVDLLVERHLVQSRTIDEAAVRATWERRYGRGGRLLDVRVLQKKPSLPADAHQKPPEEQLALIEAAKAEARSALEALKSRALDGEDFGALANRESDDPVTRTRGGRSPERFFPYSQWPETVRQALDDLQPGAIAGPIGVGPAYYLFELVSERTVPFDSVKDSLRAELKNAPPSATERAGALNKLVDGHAYEVHPENFGG